MDHLTKTPRLFVNFALPFNQVTLYSLPSSSCLSADIGWLYDFELSSVEC